MKFFYRLLELLGLEKQTKELDIYGFEAMVVYNSQDDSE